MNPRVNIIVPNVYWGLDLNYEADLICVSPAGYATEIEIKVSRGDIKRDLAKDHCAHNAGIIRRFFYAVPDYLADCEYLPADCGLITVDKHRQCKTIRPPRQRKARRLTVSEHAKLLHLGCMRIWGLKESLMRKRREKEDGARKPGGKI